MISTRFIILIGQAKKSWIILEVALENMISATQPYNTLALKNVGNKMDPKGTVEHPRNRNGTLKSL
jgi:hypothetical protein